MNISITQSFLMAIVAPTSTTKLKYKTQACFAMLAP